MGNMWCLKSCLWRGSKNAICCRGKSRKSGWWRGTALPHRYCSSCCLTGHCTYFLISGFFGCDVTVSRKNPRPCVEDKPLPWKLYSFRRLCFPARALDVFASYSHARVFLDLYAIVRANLNLCFHVHCTRVCMTVEYMYVCVYIFNIYIYVSINRY